MPEVFRHFDQTLRYFDQTPRFCNSEFSILHYTQNLGAFSLRPFDQTQVFSKFLVWGMMQKRKLGVRKTQKFGQNASWSVYIDQSTKCLMVGLY